MRKTFLLLFAAVCMISFAACSQKGKEVPVDPAPVDPVAVEVPEVVKIAPADALKAFKEFAKEYGESFNNLTKDPQKYQKLAAQLQEQVGDIQRYKDDFTPKELKEYERALKIITDVSAGGTKPKAK